MSSGKRRKTSLSKKHPLFGTIVKKSFSIDLHQKSSSGITLYRIVFKVSSIDSLELLKRVKYRYTNLSKYEALNCDYLVSCPL